MGQLRCRYEYWPRLYSCERSCSLQQHFTRPFRELPPSPTCAVLQSISRDQATLQVCASSGRVLVINKKNRVRIQRWSRSAGLTIPASEDTQGGSGGGAKNKDAATRATAAAVKAKRSVILEGGQQAYQYPGDYLELDGWMPAGKSVYSYILHPLPPGWQPARFQGTAATPRANFPASDGSGVVKSSASPAATAKGRLSPAPGKMSPGLKTPSPGRERGSTAAAGGVACIHRSSVHPSVSGLESVVTRTSYGGVTFSGDVGGKIRPSLFPATEAVVGTAAGTAGSPMSNTSARARCLRSPASPLAAASAVEVGAKEGSAPTHRVSSCGLKTSSPTFLLAEENETARKKLKTSAPAFPTGSGVTAVSPSSPAPSAGAAGSSVAHVTAGGGSDENGDGSAETQSTNKRPRLEQASICVPSSGDNACEEAPPYAADGQPQQQQGATGAEAKPTPNVADDAPAVTMDAVVASTSVSNPDQTASNANAVDAEGQSGQQVEAKTAPTLHSGVVPGAQQSAAAAATTTAVAPRRLCAAKGPSQQQIDATITPAVHSRAAEAQQHSATASTPKGVCAADAGKAGKDVAAEIGKTAGASTAMAAAGAAAAGGGGARWTAGDVVVLRARVGKGTNKRGGVAQVVSVFDNGDYNVKLLIGE